MKKFTLKRKRNKAKEEALKQFRKTRKKLKSDHPELLDQIRKLYVERQKAEQRAKDIIQDNLEATEYRIDKNKSIETILKFLEISESKDFQKRVRILLSGAIH